MGTVGKDLPSLNRSFRMEQFLERKDGKFMDPILLRFLVRRIFVPAAAVLIVLIMLAGMLIWEEIKTKWQERNQR